MFKRICTSSSLSGSARLVVAALAVVLTAALITGASSPRAQAAGSAVGTVASFAMEPSAGVGLPLTAQQRIERSRYLAHRLGIDLGVPEGARVRAVEEMRRMELAQPLGAESGKSLSPSSWSFIGPEPMKDALPNFGGAMPGLKFNASGRISALATDPTTPGRVFIGAAAGGVWMTTNGGTTFKPIFDSAPTQAIGAIALDTGTTPPTIYVATGESNFAVDSYYGQGIFKSANLGVSWTHLAPTTFDHVGFTRLAIIPSHGATPATIFASVGPGVSAGRSDPVWFESDMTKLGLWVSRNSGATWTQYPASKFGGCQLAAGIPCPATDVAIDPKNPKQVLVGIEFDDVFRSSDGGATFQRACVLGKTACSKLDQLDRISIATGPGVAYALVGAVNGTIFAGFFKSTDDGLNWTAKTVPTFHNPNGTNIDGTNTNNFSQSFYDQAVLVDPANPAIIIVGGVGLYESANSGGTWSFLPSQGGTHSDQHALAIAPDRNTVYVGNDGGAYKFTISGISGGAATFTSLNSALPVGQIQVVGPHPTNNSIVLAGFQDNGTQRDTGTLPWESVETGDGGFTSFDPSNPAFAYHTFAAGSTVVGFGASGDGGLTWTDGDVDVSSFGDPGAAFYPPFVPDPKVALRVFLAAHFVYVLDFAHSKILLQSSGDLTNGCTSGACAVDDIEFLPSNDAIAWAIAMNNGIGGGGIRVMNTTQADCPDQPTCSAGVGYPGTWNDRTSNLPFGPTMTQATSIAINPFDTTGSTAYLTLSGFKAITGINHIFKTTNMGASWSPVDTGLPDIPVLKLLVDKRDTTGKTLLVATDIGVFRSTNGGASWSPLNLGVIPAVPTFDIEQNQLGTIFVGTHGRGAYQLH